LSPQISSRKINENDYTMDLKIGDIQETALITLAIRASETDRPNARIKDFKAKEIIDALGVDVSKYDPFMSHEGVVARTIMYKNELEKLIKQYPDALCINLGCGSGALTIAVAKRNPQAEVERNGL